MLQSHHTLNFEILCAIRRFFTLTLLRRGSITLSKNYFLRPWSFSLDILLEMADFLFLLEVEARATGDAKSGGRSVL